MSTQSTAQVASFDLLSQPARQRIRARVSDAGGNISTIREEVATALAALDHEAAEGAVPTNYQAQRAFLISQLTYLDHLAQSEQPQAPARGRGLWARFGRAIGRT
jgi:hypothetical protein